MKKKLVLVFCLWQSGCVPNNGTQTRKNNMTKTLENIEKNIVSILKELDQKTVSRSKVIEVEEQCKPGQFRTVFMRRELKLTKAGKAQYGKLFQVSSFQIQAGIEYENQAKLQAARDAGEVFKATRPDYAQRIEGFKSIVQNKKDQSKFYLSGGRQGNLGGFITDEQGNQYNKEDLLDVLYSSEKQPKGKQLWTRINLENLIELN